MWLVSVNSLNLVIIAFIIDIICVIIFALCPFIPITYFLKFGYAFGIIPAYSFAKVIGNAQSIIFLSNFYIYRNSSYLGYYEFGNFTQPTKLSSIFQLPGNLDPDIYSFYTVLSVIALTLVLIL